MKLAIHKIIVIAAALATPLAYASWSELDQWTSNSLSNTFTIEVPSTATTIYSRAGAYASYELVYNVDGNGTPGSYYLYGYASVQAGVAGPPAGNIQVAVATSSGGGGLVWDEKWDYNHPAGEYQAWHGGGTDGMNIGSQITAYTEIDW